jgi:uncharacterized protein (TIGR03086 family)
VMTMQDSDTQDYETAIATFRRVLGGVAPEQITSATPCASFDVGQLVDHTIGTQHMVTDALQDKPFNMAGVEIARSEQPAAFYRAAADAVAELRRDGALDKDVTLPFGTFSGEKLMGLAALDTFQHAWDLAKATGQDTDLDAELAEALMDLAVAHMAHVPRGEEPAPYGPEQTAPTGAPAADRLAAFLGRVV